MHRAALFTLITLYGSQALSQAELCQTVADAYADDNELQSLSIPLRKPTPEELALWNKHAECIHFPSQLNGYYEHPSLPMPLINVEIQTGVRATEIEILRAPPYCDSLDQHKRFGDALLAFNSQADLSTKLLTIGDHLTFVIGGFGKTKFHEGLSEAISVDKDKMTPKKLCTFARIDEKVSGSTGDEAICNAYLQKQYSHGVIRSPGKFHSEIVDGPGRVLFRPEGPEQITLDIEYTSVASRYRVWAVSLSSPAIGNDLLRKWENVLSKKIGFYGSGEIPDWVLLNERPTAIEKWPMETWVTWPDDKAKVCQLQLSPRYAPAPAEEYGRVRLNEAVGP